MAFEPMLNTPLAAMFVTLSSYLAAQWLQKKTGGHGLVNPVVIAIALVVIYIKTLNIPYDQYLKNANLIDGFLGPATVALAIPLYKQWSMIRRAKTALAVSILAACVTAAGAGFLVAHLMGAGRDIMLAILPKSTTTAIAIGIAHKIGADPSLALFFVFTTGMIGSVIASGVFKLCRIHDKRAAGFALGAACHGLGVARALQMGETPGAFAALGMSLMGIVSGILLPLVVIAVLSLHS